MNDKLERNKQTVMAFYDLMFNECQPAETIEKYAGADFETGTGAEIKMANCSFAVGRPK